MFDSHDHTFVVCAYGESDYLSDCVESLLSQTTKTHVVLATSTPCESIFDVVKSVDIPLRINPFKNGGIASDWNFALSQAATPLVTIAHQDDVYLSNYAERMIAAMNKYDKPLIFFSNYGEIRNDTPVDDNKLLRVKRAMLSPLRVGCFANSKFIRRSILSFGSAICCPSVTMCIPNLPSPVFLNDMKNNLDWEAWERASRLDGAFAYDDDILMRHRIHEGSETTHLIGDGTRGNEDLRMFERFWPSPLARVINSFYSKSQRSNDQFDAD